MLCIEVDDIYIINLVLFPKTTSNISHIKWYVVSFWCSCLDSNMFIVIHKAKSCQPSMFLLFIQIRLKLFLLTATQVHYVSICRTKISTKPPADHKSQVALRMLEKLCRLSTQTIVGTSQTGPSSIGGYLFSFGSALIGFPPGPFLPKPLLSPQLVFTGSYGRWWCALCRVVGAGGAGGAGGGGGGGGW